MYLRIFCFHDTTFLPIFILFLEVLMKTLTVLGVAASLALASTMTMADAKSDYDGKCAACHGFGVAGAPKVGEAAQWSDRIAKGEDTLYENAINGFTGETGVMPAKGGFVNLSDDEVKAIVDYMIVNSQ